ncbi:MAG TPA: hypothetical protein VEI02_02725, partial [Planctomycetota bacterium]|nr:hypothetical protein [Planctomycetota bacterium]
MTPARRSGVPGAARIVALWAAATVGGAAQESAPESRARDAAASRPSEALALEEALRARLAAPMPRLDLDLAMFGDAFFGSKPEGVRFTDDGRKVVFSWRRPEERERGTFVYDVASGALERLDDAVAPPRAGVLDADRRRRLVIKGRALVFETIAGDDVGKSVELMRFDGEPSEPRFAAGGRAAFVRVGRALWRVPVDGPGAAVIATWRDGPPEKKESPSPADSRARRLRDQFERQERGWFRVLFEKAERKKAETRPKHADDLEPKSYEAPPGWKVDDADPDPTGAFVVFRLSRPAATAPRRDRIAAFVTDSGYLETPDARAKAGDAVSESRFVIVSTADGAAKDVRTPEAPAGLRVESVRWSQDGAWC